MVSGPSLRARGGFTLLELMIAISIMLIGVAAAFGGQVSTQSVIRQSRETQLALTQLETVAESVIAQVPQDLPEGQAFADGQPVDLPTETSLRNLQVVCTYPDFVAGQPVPNPLEVVITATWTDFEGRARNLALATAVSQ
jgi:prepilin-type N-terminal cleavage/methylation domain-containing protein